jgi:hypothetical protein
MKDIENAKPVSLSKGDNTEIASVDKLLRKAINQGFEQRAQIIADVHAKNPDWTIEAIERRMEELAGQELPDWYRDDFWTSHIDRILVAGVRGGSESGRRAVQRILANCPELRREAIQQRQRVFNPAATTRKKSSRTQI